MCFILDANSFPSVFDVNSKDHAEFEPLLRWLYEHPRTSLVIGGKTYRTELKKLSRYLSPLVELKRARKLNEVEDAVVDAEETRLTALVKHRNFDDAHIVALICASGCVLFASKDRRADPFIKMKRLYPKGQARPSIYRSVQHRTLLQDKRIVNLRNVQN